jgi:hypothetical protein|tara:strand:+ start:153 stop:1190 length:1038 start_codon:yes stop_codon:yes gene_type:complete
MTTEIDTIKSDHQLGHEDAGTVTNPLDVSPEVFKSGLDRRKTNRKALMTWVADALIEDVDYGSIKIGGRVSRPSLYKAGSEKICGMLGLTPHFPNLQEYESMILGGGEIEFFLIRCELTINGRVVAEGAGARSMAQDKKDLNKCLKMCLKSAQIDATLRCAGLSEVFTQDIEDMSFDEDGGDQESEEFSRDYVLVFGKHKGKKLREVPNSYLTWMQDKDTTLDTYLKGFAYDELVCRRDEESQETETDMTGIEEMGLVTPEETDHQDQQQFQDRTVRAWPADYTRTEIQRLLIDKYIPRVDRDAFLSWKSGKIGNRGFVNLKKEELEKFLEDLVNDFKLTKQEEE